MDSSHAELNYRLSVSHWRNEFTLLQLPLKLPEVAISFIMSDNAILTIKK